MRSSRLLGTLQVALAGLALLGTGVTYASFSSAATSAGNRFAAGTVRIGDNDANGNMLQLTSALPGGTDTGCIVVTSTGTLAADVRLYATVSGTLSAYLSLTVTRGIDSSPAFDSCVGFVPDTTDYLGAGQGVVYFGGLAGFPADWTGGLVDATAASPETWTTNESRSYRFSVTLASDATAQGKSGGATFVWETRNQ